MLVVPWKSSSVLYCRAVSAAIFSVLVPLLEQWTMLWFLSSICLHWYSTRGLPHEWSRCGFFSLGSQCTTYCPELKPLVLLTCVTLPIAAALSLGSLLCCWIMSSGVCGTVFPGPRSRSSYTLSPQLAWATRALSKQIKTTKDFGGPVVRCEGNRGSSWPV